MKIEFDANELKLNAMFTAAGHELRGVGGWVRDLLRNEKPKDKDFCTDATPDEMLFIAEANGVHVIPTGLQHGTVTFVLNHVPYEITTLRIDTDTDGRHAEVEFTRDFQVDAARRDLTINAMSMDFQGNIYDYFNGQEDLANNVVRFVGDPRQRIEEDYLRILRFFRFAARFDAMMDLNTLNIIDEMKGGLDKISRERVWLEMSKLFMAKGAVNVLLTMQDTGVAQQIGLPEATPAMLNEHFKPLSSEGAMALYFAGLPNKAREHSVKWKMSSAEVSKIFWMSSFLSDGHSMKELQDLLVEGANRDWMVEALTYTTNANHPVVQHVQAFDIPVFPLTGQDLVDAGMKPGPDMGRALKTAKTVWMDDNYRPTKDQLLARALTK